jgi:hypothetical protein
MKNALAIIYLDSFSGDSGQEIPGRFGTDETTPDYLDPSRPLTYIWGYFVWTM